MDCGTRTDCNSYTIVCPPVRGDNPRAVASGFSAVQVDKPWYKYFIPLSSVHVMLSVKYIVLKIANSDSGIISIFHECMVWIEKSGTRVTDRHHVACRVMPSTFSCLPF